MRNKSLAAFTGLIILTLVVWAVPGWSETHEEYKKRIEEKYKKQAEGKDKAIQEVITILKDVGKGSEEGWINEWYKNGKEWQAKGLGKADQTPKIIFVEGSNGYEPENNAIEINIGRANIYDGEELKYGALIDLATSILHEHLHSEQWFSSKGTTAGGENKAYTGIHTMLADWLQRLQKELLSKSKEPICDQAKIAKKIQGVIGSLGTNESSLNEMSPERRKQLETEAGALYSKRNKAKDELHWNDPQSAKYVELQMEIKKCEEELKPYEKRFKEDFVFDASGFTWTNESGKTLTRKDLLERAGEIGKQAAEIIKKCEEEKKKLTAPKDPKEKDQSAVPNEQTNLFGNLFGDLCRCSCNPGVGGGSGYDPAWGCLCSGVLGGKWSAPMASSGECSISATKAAGLKPGSLSETIKNMNNGWGEKFLKLAKNLIEDIWTPQPGLSQGKTGKAGTSETLKERVERKLDQGDLDTAEGHAKTAVIMYPPLESAAKAVIPGTLPWRLEKLALSFVPSLDFGTSRRVLERTIGLDEKNQQVNKSLAQVVEWEKEWNQIKAMSEECFSLIKAKRVCECQRLFDGKIEPLNKSFNIPTGRAVEVAFERSPEEVRMGAPKIGMRSQMEQTPIPEKDALRGKLVLELDNSRRGCRYQPGLAEPVGVLEAYITDRARPGRTDQTIADMAKKVLEREGLCDCERELAEKALEIADKWIAEQGPSLKVSLQSSKTVIKKGESVDLTPTISGGSPPYSFSYIGYWAFDVTGGAITGQGQTTTSLRAKIVGAHPLDINVSDSKGQKASGNIVLNVIEDTASKPTEETPKTAKLDISLMTDKNMLNTGESAYITAAVTGGKPPYKIKWSGALSGEGTTILFKAKKTGPNSINSEATDSMGNKGSTNLTLNVGTDKTQPKETPKDNTTKKTISNKVRKSKIIELGSKPETSSSPLTLKVPQGEQTQTLFFTYEHLRADTKKKEYIYIYPPPSATTFMIKPSDSGAFVTRISNPAKWGNQKLFAVKINRDVKPGKKFTLTAYYSGVPGSSSRYQDTGEDAEEYLKKNVKPAVAIIEVVKGKSSEKTDTIYNPLDDVNIKESGTKTIDITAVDKIGSEFQGEQTGFKQNVTPKDNQKSPVTQPDTYTGSTKKQDDATGSQNTYIPPYPPYQSDDNKATGKDWTEWVKTKNSSKNTSSNTSGETVSPTSTQCDPAQKQAAYNEGYKCGQKARQNNNKMTSDCLSIPQAYMNKDNKMGWGPCLYSGFDEGYRAGIGMTSTSSSSSGTQEVMAELENKSSDNAHIFVEGQDNFGPKNKLTPGEKRKVSVKVPSKGGFIKFIAGRNGQKLAECRWDYTPDSSTRVPVVKFSDPKSLTCVTGLR